MSAPWRGSTSAKRPMQTVQQSSCLCCPPSALGFRGAGGKCHPIVRARDHIQTAELPKGSEPSRKRTVLKLPTLRDITAIPQSTPEKELVVTGRHSADGEEGTPLASAHAQRKATSNVQTANAGPAARALPAFPGQESSPGVRPQRGTAGRAAQRPEGQSPLATGLWTLST